MLSKLVLEKIAHHYRPQYGEETDEIFLSLISHDKKVAMNNSFVEDGLLKNYYLDEASMLSSKFLPLKEGMRVLDMCSAPGGKLLGLIFRQIARVNFVANDLSSARANRLKRVLSLYLPKSFIKEYVQVTNKDGIKFGLKDPESFDAILLDAPCSSEGHLVKDEKYISKFNGLSKSLPKRQYALLCSGLLALRQNGYLMYVTCSINYNENDGVIERLVKKKKHTFQIIDMNLPKGRKTKMGWQILPHKDKAGPLYLCLLQKN